MLPGVLHIPGEAAGVLGGCSASWWKEAGAREEENSEEDHIACLGTSS